jgi:hypothetical protein
LPRKERERREERRGEKEKRERRERGEVSEQEGRIAAAGHSGLSAWPRSRACTRRGGEQRRVDDICVVASFRGGPVVQSHKEESRK